MTGTRLVLASASPRRLDLLRELGLVPETLPTGIPEDPLPGEAPRAHVERLAGAKGHAAWTRLTGAPAVVLAADTAVVLDGEILGKPRDDADAASMLRRLSGRVHEVLTAVDLRHSGSGASASTVETTRVRFRPYPPAFADWYASTGEPRDKAGAYGIQGLGVLLAEGIEGSWSNVVGLPLERLPALFDAVGLDLRAFLPDRGGPGGTLARPHPR